MPIHFIGSHSSIRHRTLLLISIYSHINTPYPLSSFMLFPFYPSIHFLLSLIPSSLTTLLHSHSSSHHSSHSFLSTSSLSHSILIPSFIHFHFNTTLLYSSSSLFYKHSFIRFSTSILLFVPRLLSITILLLLLLLLTPLSTIILFHTHSHTLHSIHSLLSFRSFYSNHLLYHSYSFPYSLSFNHFFYHIINHFLLLFPSHFNHSSFNKHNNQIST